jgi:hypothetical protein
MFKQTIFLAAVVILSGAILREARAQSDERGFEVGGQFSLVRLTSPRAACIFKPACPNQIILAERHEFEPGVGGRFSYNFSRHVALEAEGNLFPRDRELNGGRKIQALFGVKAGERFDRVGVFAKARPGFVRYEKAHYRETPGILCVAVFPPPLGCFTPSARTNLAFDLGGVVEVYPSRHTIIRFDAGDTIIRLNARNAAVSDGGVGLAVLAVPAETTHNFQGSIGIGFRF